MNMNEHKIKALARKYSRFIKWSDEDDCYIGSLPDFEKDCTHGNTLEEVSRNLQEVAEMYIEGYLEEERKLPRPRAVVISPSPFRETGNEENIARLRKSQGMSQKDFAAVLGVSPSTLIKWEHGLRRPSGSSAKLLELISKHPELLQA